MASPIRPHERLDKALIMTFSDAAQPTFATRGAPVKFNGSDTLLAACSANDPLMIGYVYATSVTPRDVSVVMLGSAVMPVTVGTGGATRGVHAVVVADGYTDAATASGGTVAQYIAGKFLQTGVAGDVVGLMIGTNMAAIKAS